MIIYLIFNYPLKINFPNKDPSYYNPNTPDANCKSINLIEKPGFNGFIKIIGTQINYILHTKS